MQSHKESDLELEKPLGVPQKLIWSLVVMVLIILVTVVSL
jgi:hypothetical protein